MFSMPHGAELVIILVIVVVVFGPWSLPRLGKSINGFFKNFRREAEEDGYEKGREEE